jgi:hypothetical protein
MLEDIAKLRDIRTEMSVLEVCKEKLKRPVLEDFAMLPTLYEWFKDILSDKPLPPDPDSVTQRKKFLFVVVVLYSPATFCGYATKARLRKELARMFGVADVTISRNIADMLFFYDNYNDFQSETEAMYEQIKSRLEAFLNTGNL